MSASAPLFTLQLDQSGRVRGCDDVACAVLGWPRDALVGRRLSEIAPAVELDGPSAAGLETQVATAHSRHLHAEVWVSAPLDGGRTVLMRETPVALPLHRLFGAQLSDLLRRQPDPPAVLRAAVQAIGEELGVSRATWSRVLEDGDTAVVAAMWTDGALETFEGERSLRAVFGRAVVESFRRGEVLANADALADPRLSAVDARRFADRGVRAICSVPVRKDGRLAAVLSLHACEPRPWSAVEVRIAEDAAERVLDALERADAAARLEASEAQFRSLAENLPNLCWISSPTGEVLWGNRRYMDYYAWRMREAGLIGENLTVHPDDRDASVTAWARAYATGEPLMLRMRSRDAAGVYRPFLCQAEPIRDAEGRVVRWCGILTDLSSQQAREEAQRFLLELGEALREEGEPLAVLRESCARLGRYLGADRVGYGEFSDDSRELCVCADWGADGLESLTGFSHRYSEDSATLAAYRAGETLVCENSDELPPGTDARRLLVDVLRCRSSVSIALARGGRLFGLFGVYRRDAHVWTPDEISLVQEVGERTWAALERARAEAASRGSEEQFRTFAESLPDIAFVVDAAGAPLWWNRRHEELLGPGRGMGHVAVMCHPDEVEGVMAGWAASMAQGVPIHAECRLMCVDGRYRLFRAHATPVKDDTGVVVRWCGLVSDVTAVRSRERTQAFLLELGDGLRRLASPDEELQFAAEALQAHLGCDSVGFAELDEAGERVRVRHEARTGRLPSSVGEAALDDLVQELVAAFRAGRPVVLEDLAARLAADPALAAYKPGPVRANLSIPLMIEGKLRVILYASHADPREWSDADVEVVREVAERTWAGVERARAEAAQRETEALLTSILDHAPVGIYVKDLEGRYLLVNPEMCKLLGRPKEEILGRTAFDVVDADYAAEVAAHDRWVMDTGETHISERKLGYGQTGSYDWSLITRFPVTPRQGAPRQVAGINVNLTAQKAAEQALERSREALYQSEKLTALGSLLAGVSHELNNPLSIVVAQSVMMERQADGGPLAERARQIRGAADRCARIVQTFLAMARQRTPERRRVDLNGVVEAALELTAYGLRTSGVQLVRDQARDLPAISADADQLHQVIINLVVNAQHAMQGQSGPRVLAVRTAPGADGATVVLEVADNGPGVPEELRRRVFEPFFTTKPQEVGTGVGLSFSLGLVEAHGGRLELGETPGGGATFRVVLPISAAAEPIVAPASVLAAAGAPLRTALVIDDEPQIARALAEFLEFEGYRCDTVFGGTEAQARLSAGGDYDLILSDLRMPDVDGPSLFAWIKAERPELAGRVAFSTGDTLGSNAVRFLAREGRPFMEKPFTPDSLRALLDDVRDASGEA